MLHLNGRRQLYQPVPGSRDCLSSAAGGAGKEDTDNLWGQLGWLKECLDQHQTSEASATNAPASVSDHGTCPEQLQQPAALPETSSSGADQCQIADHSPNVKLEDIAKDHPATGTSLSGLKDQAQPAFRPMMAQIPGDLQSAAATVKLGLTADVDSLQPKSHTSAAPASAVNSSVAEPDANHLKKHEQNSLTLLPGSSSKESTSAALPESSGMRGGTSQAQPAIYVQIDSANPESKDPSQMPPVKQDSAFEQLSKGLKPPAASQRHAPELAVLIQEQHVSVAACQCAEANPEAAACQHDAGDYNNDAGTALLSHHQHMSFVPNAVPALLAATDQALSAKVKHAQPTCQLPKPAATEHGEAGSSSGHPVPSDPASQSAVALAHEAPSQPCSVGQDAETLTVAPNLKALQPPSTTPRFHACKAGDMSARGRAVVGCSNTDELLRAAGLKPSSSCSAAAGQAAAPCAKRVAPLGSAFRGTADAAAPTTVAVEAQGIQAQASEHHGSPRATAEPQLSSAALKPKETAAAGPPLDALDSYLRGEASWFLALCTLRSKMVSFMCFIRSSCDRGLPSAFRTMLHSILHPDLLQEGLTCDKGPAATPQHVKMRALQPAWSLAAGDTT